MPWFALIGCNVTGSFVVVGDFTVVGTAVLEGEVADGGFAVVVVVVFIAVVD